MVLEKTDDAFQAKRKTKNFWLAVCLAAFILTVFLVTIAKLSSGGVIEGFDHTLRPSLLEEQVYD